MMSPSQIHGYLSSNYKDLRVLEKNDPFLRSKAYGRWYVADPKKQEDIEKVRLKDLLREFETYKVAKAGKLKTFRTEAVRAGFGVSYALQDYRSIVMVAEKLPEVVVQEDDKLLMYYDVAVLRLGVA